MSKWVNKRRRFLTGFTLVEILIAVSLLTVVGVAAFTTFRGGTAAWQQGTAHAQRQAGTRAVLEMMARELSKATLVDADGIYQIDFLGEANRIFFIGSLETPRAGQPDLVKARYDLSAGFLGRDGVTRRNLRRAFAPIDTRIMENFPAIPPPPTLASDITKLEFRFFDAQSPFTSPFTTPHWRTTWDSRGVGEVITVDPATVGTLPDAVRITLTSHPEGLAAKTFSIITELPRAEPQPFGFSISLSPSSDTVVQGGSVTTAVTVELTGGITETVNLSVIVPAGITGTFSVPSSGSPTFSRTLTLSAGSAATPGTHTIEVRGVSAGGIVERAFYTLTVHSPFNYSLSVSPQAVSIGRPVVAESPNTIIPTVTATLATGAKPREITLSVTVPAALTGNTTATISPSLGTPTFNALLTINVTNTTPLGNHTITITGSGGGIANRTITFTLSVFDFTLSAGNISSGRGGSQTNTVTATLITGSGTPASVTTSSTVISGPTGHNAAHIGITGHGTITPTGSLSLTVAVNAAAVLGNYTIRVTAEGGDITRTTTFTLSVFNLATLSSPNLTILRGGSRTNTVTATLAAGSGTPASVTTSHGTLPTGVGITGHGTITPTGSRTLTVSTTNVTPGTYTIEVRATGGGGTRTTTFTLTIVNLPPTASFTFSPSSPSFHEIISFTDTSTDPDGTVVSWHWDFGDGTTSTLQHPTKIYTTGGTKTVTLTVTDNWGATGSVSQNIFVEQTWALDRNRISSPARNAWTTITSVTLHLRTSGHIIAKANFGHMRGDGTDDGWRWRLVIDGVVVAHPAGLADTWTDDPDYHNMVGSRSVAAGARVVTLQYLVGGSGTDEARGEIYAFFTPNAPGTTWALARRHISSPTRGVWTTITSVSLNPTTAGHIIAKANFGQMRDDRTDDGWRWRLVIDGVVVAHPAGLADTWTDDPDYHNMVGSRSVAAGARVVTLQYLVGGSGTDEARGEIYAFFTPNAPGTTWALARRHISSPTRGVWTTITSVSLNPTTAGHIIAKANFGQMRDDRTDDDWRWRLVIDGVVVAHPAGIADTWTRDPNYYNMVGSRSVAAGARVVELQYHVGGSGTDEARGDIYAFFR
ncbi:MAG: Protease 1 [Syntrophomonadaceae bacterium]|nr:Protease 1 [Bacillota bacterium]